MADPRVDRKPFQHGSVRPSLQQRGSRTRNQLSRLGCHAIPMWVSSDPKAMPSDHASTFSKRFVPRQVPRTDLPAAASHAPTLSKSVYIPSDSPNEHDAFQENRYPGNLPPPKIHITNMLQNLVFLHFSFVGSAVCLNVSFSSVWTTGTATPNIFRSKERLNLWPPIVLIDSPNPSANQSFHSSTILG